MKPFPEVPDREDWNVRVRTRIRDGRSDRKPLNDQQRADLYQLIQLPGWMTLLQMMEDVCIQQETDLVNVPIEDHSKIVGEHAISKAMWLFFTRVQKKVVFEVNEMFAERDKPATDQEAEEIAAILDATQE